jgi:DNA-binding CsgD family transcriptional regulator
MVPSNTAKSRRLGDWSRYDDRRIFGAVPALARGDAERLLRFVAEAESFGGDHPFSGEFLTQLGRLVPADWVGYYVARVDQASYDTECPAQAEYGPIAHSVRPGDEDVYSGVDWAAVMPVVKAECPVFARFHPGDFSTLKISDVVSRRELYRTPMYSLLLKPCGFKDSLELRLCIGPGRIAKVGFDRGGRDFSARDRALLDVVNPHLVRLYRSHENRRRLSAALALHESMQAAVVLLEADDRVAFASTAARELFKRYFGKWGMRLPDSVAAWVRERRVAVGEPLRIDSGNRSLAVHFVDNALLLEERRRLPRLTPRERQILDLVAEGKTNAQIAERLWVSPGTVRKHLDNVYAKLGVHTRTAAAAFVRELKEPSA